MKVLKLLLYPLAALFNLGTSVRNYLYDSGQKPSVEFETAVISVGNLNVGGSGKTPMVEYLVRLLKNDYRIATLSRGYGRKTTGYRKAGEADTASSIGDEPFQLYRKFGTEVNVVVCEDRVHAIPHILQDFPETKVIVLDDALQHRSVKPRLSLMVTEYTRPFYKDFVLPFGRLREARKGASRADVIVVTKCGEIKPDERKAVEQAIQRYAGDKPVFFSRIRYDEPAPIGASTVPDRQIVLVTGIAKTDSLANFCKSNYQIIKHFRYPDHHRYTQADLTEIEHFVKHAAGQISIITTEKDMVKLIAPENKRFLDNLKWFYLPIRHEFIQDGPKFDEVIRRAAKGV